METQRSQNTIYVSSGAAPNGIPLFSVGLHVCLVSYYRRKTYTQAHFSVHDNYTALSTRIISIVTNTYIKYRYFLYVNVVVQS